MERKSVEINAYQMIEVQAKCIVLQAAVMRGLCVMEWI